MTAGVAMIDGNRGNTIAMGDNGGGVMDCGKAAQLWRLPRTATAAIGDGNSGSMIALGNGGGSAMDSVMVA